jgi:predicted dithiol-disulfide oxidoreductase (DUF899 family)
MRIWTVNADGSDAQRLTVATKGEAMIDHKIGTREEWTAAREKLLRAREGVHEAGRRAGVRAARTALGPSEKEYRFETDEGTRTLPELFDGRSQLCVYHFMFGPSYEAGCTTCSSIADAVDGVRTHLNAHDMTMLFVSQGPLEKLQAYKRRMGWSFPWVSSANTE